VLFAPSVEELKALDKNDHRHFLLDLLQRHQGGKLPQFKLDGEKNQAETIIDDPHFWGLIDKKNNSLWKGLLQNRHAWLLVDLHCGDSYEEGRPECHVILTSTLRKDRSGLLWTVAAT